MDIRSVMFYYTPEFAVVTPNISNYLDQIVGLTNMGFENSKIPVRIYAFCHELATINEATTTNSTLLLNSFANMKSSVEKLRNSADAAVLITKGSGHSIMSIS